jgi:hypothetical protein
MVETVLNTLENTNTTQTIVKKRGRKPKKEIEQQAKGAEIKTVHENIHVSMEIKETEPFFHEKGNTGNIMLDVNENINKLSKETQELNNQHLTINVGETSENENEQNRPVQKKRGRKPKGGKIIQQVVPQEILKEKKPFVILHLKCFLKDLQTNQTEDKLECFNFVNNTVSYINDDPPLANNDSMDDMEVEKEHMKVNCRDMKEIWKKLKHLEQNLHANNVDCKKSACFWDTCEFDNPPVYIPKHYINNTYQVYGCFCSPECAVAYLMEENIDSSIKFERYQLLNHIYSKVYNYNKNIKPSPNPYYMLDKFYGNLSIQEYRLLLQNERLFLIIDKPLTRVMPELHEDNDDFIINNKIIPNNSLKLKKNVKRQTKTNILNEHFGMTNENNLQ